MAADIPVVELDGVVHAVSAAHVVQAIERADAAGSPLLVLRLEVASHGLLTAGGIVAMVLGASMLVDAPTPEMRIALSALLPAVIAVALGTFALVRMVIRAQRRTATTGVEGLQGRTALAETDLALQGWVRIQGERWSAESQSPVRAGEAVHVVSVSGLLLRVRPRGPGATANE